MKKNIVIILILASGNLVFGQKNFPKLEASNIFPALIKNCFYDKKEKAFKFFDKCKNEDTLTIRLDTLIAFNSWDAGKIEKKILIFTIREKNSECHACAPIVGYFLFQKTKDGKWMYEKEKMDLVRMGEWGESPKYKLLQSEEFDGDLLVEFDGAGNGGYYYYNCNIFDLTFDDRRIFYFNELNGVYSNDETKRKLTFNLYYKKSKNEKILCVHTKGVKDKAVKVNFIEFFKYSERYDFFIPLKK